MTNYDTKESIVEGFNLLMVDCHCPEDESERLNSMFEKLELDEMKSLHHLLASTFVLGQNIVVEKLLYGGEETEEECGCEACEGCENRSADDE